VLVWLAGSRVGPASENESGPLSAKRGPWGRPEFRLDAGVVPKRQCDCSKRAPRRSRHAKSRSPDLSVLKACDLHRGLDRVGVVCLAIVALRQCERGTEAPMRIERHISRKKKAAGLLLLRPHRTNELTPLKMPRRSSRRTPHSHGGHPATYGSDRTRDQNSCSAAVTRCGQLTS
jgi:hypothetical protein